MKPTKKYTVVTGASSGIGRETAKAFANRGRNLIVAARRTENLEALKREVTERHPTGNLGQQRRLWKLRQRGTAGLGED